MSEIPDYTDLYWGLPPESVKAALDARRSAPLPSHFSDPEESRAVVMLAAAYPSVRRQVLESVVEDAARRLYREYPAAAMRGWDEIAESSRESIRTDARRLLGLDGGEAG